MTGEKDAPAEMPGAEEIARLVSGVMNRDNHALALHTARQIAALFAPILAEKETLERANAELVAVVNDRRFVRCGEECYAHDDDPNCALEGKFQQEIEHFAALAFDDLGKNPPVAWRDRALAAEAALTAERERCIAIVDAQVPDWVKERSGPYWDGYREAMEDAAEDMRKGAPARAAAIRAEGE